MNSYRCGPDPLRHQHLLGEGELIFRKLWLKLERLGPLKVGGDIELVFLCVPDIDILAA